MTVVAVGDGTVLRIVLEVGEALETEKIVTDIIVHGHATGRTRIDLGHLDPWSNVRLRMKMK